MTEPKSEAVGELQADSRLDALEQHVAHQGRMLDDLNATVTAQWAALDLFKRHLAQLTERLAEAEAQVGAPPTQKPPHY